MEILVQILGILALGVAICSMLLKEKPQIMLFITIYNILTLISYLLLGQYLGCILISIAAVRSFTFFLFSIKNSRPNILAFILFNILGITFSIIFWASWYDIFMFINLIANTYATWQTNVKIIKITTVVCTVFYVLYDIFVGAYSYIISELAFGVVALYSLIKHKDEKKWKLPRCLTKINKGSNIIVWIQYLQEIITIEFRCCKNCNTSFGVLQL